MLIDMRPAGGLTGVPRYAQLLAETVPAQDLTRRYMAFAWNGQNPGFDIEVARSPLPGRVLWTLNRSLGVPAPRWGMRPFDVFHGTTLNPIRFWGARTIATIHDCFWLSVPGLYPFHEADGYDRATRSCVRFADHIITVSEDTKAIICTGYGVPRDRVTVAYPPVSPRLTNRVPLPQERRREIADKPFILTVGDIAPRKNLQRLIEAFLRIADGLDHHLVLAGPATYDPPHARSLREFVAGGPQAHRIHFLGPVTDGELRWLYSRADVFAFPSLYEGFGLPLVEAMEWGRAIMTSNVSAIPEVVGDAALQVDPLSVDEMAVAIDTLIRDDQVRADLQRRARERAGMFTAERFVAGILDAYRKIGA